MTFPDIYVLGTARTAIGTFGGALKDVPNTQLATTAVRAAIERSGLAPDAIGHVVMGNVVPTDTREAYLARVAAGISRLPSSRCCRAAAMAGWSAGCRCTTTSFRPFCCIAAPRPGASTGCRTWRAARRWPPSA